MSHWADAISFLERGDPSSAIKLVYPYIKRGDLNSVPIVGVSYYLSNDLQRAVIYADQTLSCMRTHKFNFNGLIPVLLKALAFRDLGLALLFKENRKIIERCYSRDFKKVSRKLLITELKNHFSSTLVLSSQHRKTLDLVQSSDDLVTMKELKLVEVLHRELDGKNISDVAKKAGISVSLLHDWYKSRRMPGSKNFPSLLKLSSYLGLSLEELLFDIDNSNKEILAATVFTDGGVQYRCSIEKIKGRK